MIYRIEVTNIEEGYVEVTANNEESARELAIEENNNGGFIGNTCEAQIGDIIEARNDGDIISGIDFANIFPIPFTK